MSSKSTYELYSPGTKVYGMSRYHSDGKPTDHVAIYDAVVVDVTVSYDKENNCDKVSYWLKTPEGEEWGNSVLSDEVHHDINQLIKSIKKEWKSNSNSH